ncbi:MAG: hypothetical protein IPI66_13680 [Chitinophagaceae bacterium]|nr:hypothetical protein [Chitinophagaceae bacterium]
MDKNRIIFFIPVLAFFFLFSCDQGNKAKPEKQEERPLTEKDTVKNRPCREVVMDLLTDTDRFREITRGLNEAIKKNGGTSYGLMLEASPDPARDEANDRSAFYEISLHESYPDRMTVTARFRYNPEAQRLYQVDPVEDTLIPLNFDRRYALEMKKACR